MNLYASALILLAVSLLQVTSGAGLPAVSQPLPLVPATVVIWTILRGPQEGLRWAIPGGLLLGVLGDGPLGAPLLSLLVVAFLAGLMRRFVSQATLLWPVLAAVAGVAMNSAFTIALLVAGGHQINLLRTLELGMPRIMVLAGIVAPPLYLGLRALDRRFPLSPLPDF
jgi:hypothetical protein